MQRAGWQAASSKTTPLGVGYACMRLCFRGAQFPPSFPCARLPASATASRRETEVEELPTGGEEGDSPRGFPP